MSPASVNGRSLGVQSNGVFNSANTDPIPGGRLWPEAALTWNAMRKAALADGIQPWEFAPNGPRSSAREIGAQRVFFANQPPAAARPGTSNHGWGIAVDVNSRRAAAWISGHGSRYGWSHDEGLRVGEWWHYRYVGMSAPALRQLKRSADPLRALSRPERKHADRLLWHRRGYRHEARSGKGPKFQAHKKHAANYRKWVEERVEKLRQQDTKRFKRARRIAILQRVLVATDGRYVELPAATLRQRQRKMDPLAGLSRPEREHAERLLWHRRSYRREARSSKGAKFKAHKQHAANYRKWIETRIQQLGAQDTTQFNRARRIHILKRVVQATDGNL